MKAIVVLSVSLLVLSCASISYQPPPSAVTSTNLLIELAKHGDKDLDGDWLYRKENDELLLTVFYIREQYAGCAVSDGYYSYGGYCDIREKKYYGIMAMMGNIVDQQELSEQDFCKLVKEFLKIWNTTKSGKMVNKGK